MNKKKLDYKLWAIFGLGLLLRILFLLKGASIYYGVGQHDIYYNGDSLSYMRSFENLLLYGQYTFDFMEPDAAFGRLPGYPFFYGLHYLLVGQAYAPQAVACTQTLLDSCSILLIYNIVWRLLASLGGGMAQQTWPPYAGALLYATYPFTIVFTPLIATESLATFLTLAWLALLLHSGHSVKYFVLLALLLVVAFYVREYLGILVPISCVYLWVTYRPVPAATIARSSLGLLPALLLVSGIFGAFYAIWPIRNFLSFHRLVLVKTTTAGYANYKEDFTSYRHWVLSWTNDEQPWLDGAIASPTVAFPVTIFASSAEAAEARKGVALANQCGSSFYLWQKGHEIGGDYQKYLAVRKSARFQQNCNSEVSAIFQQLQASYQTQHPVGYWLNVPGQNLFKAFFKSAKQVSIGSGGAKTLLIRMLFGWRTLLLLLGFGGVAIYWRQPQFWPIGSFASFMYFFICFVMRNLEMRYLIQADAVLLPVVPVVLAAIWCRMRLPHTSRVS